MERSEKGNTVYLRVGIWYGNKGHIRIATSDEPAFISSVSRDAKSKRGNPNLYKKLKKCLEEADVPEPKNHRE